MRRASSASGPIHDDDDGGAAWRGFRWRSAAAWGRSCGGRWASTMVGGLLVSQVLTLYTTPVIYIFFDKLGQRFLAQARSAGDERWGARGGAAVKRLRAVRSSAGATDRC